MPAVSLVATLAAAVAGSVLGSIWYGPLFGRAWRAASRPSSDDVRGDVSPFRTYGATLVPGLIASYVFGVYLGPDPGRAFAVVVGASVGVFLVATSLATTDLLARRPVALMVINGGYHAVRFTLIGLVFGLLG